MAVATQPLLQFLSTRGPQFQPVPGFIGVWEDFNFSSLMECCGSLFYDMLQYPVRERNPSDDEDSDNDFAAEDSLEKRYVSSWVFRTINKGLKVQRQFEKLKAPYVKMAPGSEGNGSKKFRLYPDWAGIRKIKGVKGAVNILPGDTKVSNKWMSSKVILGNLIQKKFKADWALPIRQIYTYCRRFETRYGYIITDQEVVAVRIREPSDLPTTHEGMRPDQGSIEFVSITDGSVSASGRNQLTKNLAIWWLHLLAANDRGIRPSYAPLRHETLRDLATPLTISDTVHAPSARASVAPTEATSRASPTTEPMWSPSPTPDLPIMSPQSTSFGPYSSSPATRSFAFAPPSRALAKRKRRRQHAAEVRARPQRRKKP